MTRSSPADSARPSPGHSQEGKHSNRTDTTANQATRHDTTPSGIRVSAASQMPNAAIAIGVPRLTMRPQFRVLSDRPTHIIHSIMKISSIINRSLRSSTRREPRDSPIISLCHPPFRHFRHIGICPTPRCHQFKSFSQITIYIMSHSKQ